MPVERPYETKANQRAQPPRSEMEQLQLMPGRKAHRLQRRVADRKQRQVWDVASAEQPPAQLRVVLGMVSSKPNTVFMHPSHSIVIGLPT
jgi:hypothetical protein